MAFWKQHQTSAEYLGSVAFFADFAPQELARIAELGTDVRFASGELLMDQGKVGQICYVIVEGSASVYANAEHIASLGSGSMVGEMALVEHRPRVASVVASEDTRTLAFDTDAFGKLLDEMPKVADKVRRLLMERLQANANRR